MSRPYTAGGGGQVQTNVLYIYSQRLINEPVCVKVSAGDLILLFLPVRVVILAFIDSTLFFYAARVIVSNRIVFPS